MQEAITVVQDRRIILGVTGSIAAYKAADLASKLTQVGAQVDVIMTDAAQRFITPLAFQAVTGRPVYTSMWQPDAGGGLPTHIAHVGLGEGADLLVIAPATANTLAKLAHGLADDLLSVTALAARCPVVVAPAMDGGMYTHPATQANLDVLRARGVVVIEPDEGRFASGLVGKGRLPETQALLGQIRRVLGREGSLASCRVVVTAGGTRESIDPVRQVTNRSSGKQGYALAQAALDAGADVTLISAASGLPVPVGAELIPVTTAEEMQHAVLAHVERADVLIMAAAVADFRPATVAAQKIKKSGDNEAGLTIALERTPDILEAVKVARADHGWPRVVIGFAAESRDLLENAQAKLARKGLDLIAANDISATDAGFEVDTNRIVLLDADGGVTELGLTSKAAVGEAVVRRAASLLRAQRD
ncbi:bifunctional phosphopantothenoylcysteine decarboxylase/phosphopantothenate--cysteine ligase CoaBC [Aggregatilinea lenta]|uniref:bifunctional phosphopantothenoylcysteine decarboxylase/phosphopantothenate--cysteine ligase CoaBC n=1 Tax=Aggregatilinea lenta TaxID=913108 RepID=UPI001EE917F3|nr:bifunctional phosphopantothenoylcysteine decarboxylase/phosphopantothenate--cysteine ligase CoaBC [Aggregatilinea lenta]